MTAGALISVGVGAVVIDPGEVLAVLSRRLGVSLGPEPSFQASAVLWEIRLPRILLGIVVGGVLGATGAGLQGLMRNPLADPQLLGIGPGASVGAVLALVVLADGTSSAIAGGTLGAIGTVVFVRRLADDPSPTPTRLILSGIALGAVLSAWVGFLVFSIGRNAVPPIEFWLLGSLTGATWRVLTATAVICGLAVIALISNARSLDVLALGESEASHLGVDVEQVRT
ncbi:MAG: iron ABC transporter permease, partial [Acidimicrobiia bacterium]|nr:iron ABC transporter permease [Acidimicrobiia bacterium]NNL47597.1 iron ABC transporter permease [Acidimicrobiia bacterium]